MIDFCSRPLESVGVRRWPAILLLLAFLALGSGGFEYVHNHQHLHDGVAHADGDPHHDDAPTPAHDAANCFLHHLLRAPLLSIGWTPILVCLGLFVAFLTLLSPPLIAQRQYVRIDCRGPPAC